MRLSISLFFPPVLLTFLPAFLWPILSLHITGAILYYEHMGHSVKIDSLSFGGCGVGRVSGKVVFVPYSAPGDEIRTKIIKEEKGFMEGSIVELISPSPIRKEPPCPYHSICGGCHWLHIPYSEQVKAKEEIFKDTLKRIGKVDPSIVEPIQPSPMELNYRSRVQLKVWENKIGFYKRESHELVDISECPLAHPLINRILKGLREIWPPIPYPIARVDINVSPSDEKGIVSIYLKDRSTFDFARFFKMLNQAIPEVTGLIIHYNRDEKVCGSPYLFSKEGGFRFRASEGSFSQVNYHQNLNMKDYILSLVDLRGSEGVLELYSGGGNFTIPLARQAGNIVGIEVSEASISDAIENTRLNDIKNAVFIKATAEKGMEKVLSSGLGVGGGKTIDLVLVDPPRDGCSKKVIEGIVSLKPGKVIYVSCNPSTLARDLSRFRELGYKTWSSRPFDMFPQTYHIESVTELGLF